MRRLLAVGIGIAAAFAALPSMALGAPYEPNDSRAQAYGPLTGGTTYTAESENSLDDDWYYFYVNNQRQIEIQTDSETDCFFPVSLHDADGNQLMYAYRSKGKTHYIRYTAPSAGLYYLKEPGREGCKYSFKINPADAVTTNPPGTVVTLGPGGESDDVQRLFVNDALIGQITGTTTQSFSLGVLDPSTRIRLEAENAATYWSWKFNVTEFVDRAQITRFTEAESGGSSSDPRIGLVRRVTISPSGNMLDSCGERIAPTPCIPFDGDGDTYTSDVDCNDADAAIHPGAIEKPDNAVDENCDGVLGYRTKASISRRAKVFTGTVKSGPQACRAGRSVVLRRVGSGKRVFSRTKTKASGRYTIKRRASMRGRVYVVVSAKRASGVQCRAANSRKVRAR